MRYIITILLLISVGHNYAQIGINTTTPNAQLEIKSSNQATPANTDGIIIPKIDAFPVTNPTASQQSMMVYLTTTSAGKQPGFYYWDNATTNWIGINTNANNTAWLRSVTATTPNNTDDIYHNGRTSIGWNPTPTRTLDVRGNGIYNQVAGQSEGIYNYVDTSIGGNVFGEYTRMYGNGLGASVGNFIKIENTNNSSEHDGIWLDMTNVNTTNNNRNGVRLDISGTASVGWHVGLNNSINSNFTAFGRKVGVLNSINGSGENYGMYSSFSTGSYAYGTNNVFSIPGIGLINGFSSTTNAQQYGVYNNYNGLSTGINYGVFNGMSQGTGNEYGVYNDLRNFNASSLGNKYGIYTEIDGTSNANKYGAYTLIPNTSGGTHYGIFCDVKKAFSYAGYFLGNVSIGTSTTNNYILPTQRGSLNDIIQTDGSGATFWINNSVRPYTTTGASAGIYIVAYSEHTVRVLNSVSEVKLPGASGIKGKIFNIIGSNGISSKILSTFGGVIYDDVTNTNITTLNPNQRFTVQSDGTDWIVIGN